MSDDSLFVDFAAEDAALGAALANVDAVDALCDTCRPADFYQPSRAAVAQVIADLHSAGEPVDIVNVSAKLSGKVEKSLVHSLPDTCPTFANVRQYTAIVVDLARRRRLSLAAHQAQERLAQSNGDGVGLFRATIDAALTADEKLAVSGPRSVQVFYPAHELRDYVSPHIDWVIEKLLAKGVFTIFGGKPKAGKTTFAFGAVYAMQVGCPFMGLQTHKARVLFITEQNKTTIRPKLAEYGLLDSPDLHLMFPRQMLGLTWDEIIDQATTYCEDHDIDVVIVDTVNDLCHLENSFSDTEWIDALDPLQRLAQHGGMAVFASLHAKKEAASLVDMFRGSNAIVGKADIVLGLWRDGSGDETTRTVEGTSRLDNGFDERTRIVRDGREYMTSGTVKEMELEAKLAEYMDALPTSCEAAVTRQELAAALDVTAGTVSTYITKLVAAGKVLCETRPGTGHAKLYWAAGSEE